MEYIRQMQREDLNVMSEFLVMAATLLDIKCKMLLPKEVKEDGEEEDPRQELVEQLLQYKMYKYMSYELRDRQVDADLILYKTPTIPEEVLEYVEPVDLDLLLGDLTMVQLKKVFQEVMRRQTDKVDPVRSKFGKIEKKKSHSQISSFMCVIIYRNTAGSVSVNFFRSRRVNACCCYISCDS